METETNTVPIVKGTHGLTDQCDANACPPSWATWLAPCVHVEAARFGVTVQEALPYVDTHRSDVDQLDVYDLIGTDVPATAWESDAAHLCAGE